MGSSDSLTAAASAPYCSAMAERLYVLMVLAAPLSDFSGTSPR